MVIGMLGIFLAWAVAVLVLCALFHQAPEVTPLPDFVVTPEGVIVDLRTRHGTD